MNEERVEYYGITDPPGVTIPDEMKPYILELLRLQKKERKYRWISTERKDPENEGDYLTVCKHKINGNRWIAISYYNPPYGWDVAGIGWSETNVTHWMPLPELPAEGGTEK